MFRLPMLPEKTTTGSLKTDFPLRGNVGFKNPTYIHKDTTARNSFQAASNAVGTPQRQPENPTQKELPMNPVRIYRTILTAAGKQAGVLKRCLRDSIAAAGRGQKRSCSVLAGAAYRAARALRPVPLALAGL